MMHISFTKRPTWQVLMPLLIFACLIMGCANNKSFRTLNDTEKAAIKAAKKQIPSKDSLYHILLMTSKGNMVLKLYNQTPLHRDNFVQKVSSGFYDSLLFHRVMNEFMIQGGDPMSKYAKADDRLGNGSAPGNRIPAEFRTDIDIYHNRGALAAARGDNPEKESNNCQFYIVQRHVWPLAQLDSFIQVRNITLNNNQKQVYTTRGGSPHLDGNYTVFGQLETGFEVLDRIATTATKTPNRPIEDIRMRLFLLNTPKFKK